MVAKPQAPLARRIAEAVSKHVYKHGLMAHELEPIIAAELPPDDAAPQMLAALELVDATFDIWMDEGSLSELETAMRDKVRAAIAKAKDTQ